MVTRAGSDGPAGVFRQKKDHLAVALPSPLGDVVETDDLLIDFESSAFVLPLFSAVDVVTATSLLYKVDSFNGIPYLGEEWRFFVCNGVTK